MGGGWEEPGGEGRGVWGRVVGPGLWGTRAFWVSWRGFRSTPLSLECPGILGRKPGAFLMSSG